MGHSKILRQSDKDLIRAMYNCQNDIGNGNSNCNDEDVNCPMKQSR